MPKQPAFICRHMCYCHSYPAVFHCIQNERHVVVFLSGHAYDKINTHILDVVETQAHLINQSCIRHCSLEFLV